MTHQKYIQRAFDTLKDFSRDYRHHGLTLALGEEGAVRESVFDITEHMPDGDQVVRPEIRAMFEKYRGNPVLFDDDIFSVYKTMTNEQDHIDSLLSIDPAGHLIEIDGFFAPPREFYAKMMRYYDPMWGTRHFNTAAASLYDGVTAMALSERKGTITTFHGGHVVQKFCYKPR
jgi:hypothetical protein